MPVLSQSEVQESLESAQRALRWNPPGEEYLASIALMYLAFSQQATGQEIEALVTLQEALLDHAMQPSSTVRLLFSQAMTFLARANCIRWNTLLSTYCVSRNKLI